VRHDRRRRAGVRRAAGRGAGAARETDVGVADVFRRQRVRAAATRPAQARGRRARPAGSRGRPGAGRLGAGGGAGTVRRRRAGGALSVFPRRRRAEDARDAGMSALANYLVARTGPMTADMVLHPARFGLGRVPQRLQPAATAKTICGFCSTGCSLQVHLNAAGEAINLSADPDYPVNLGMACPKGWESLAPLTASDRATAPLRRERATGRRERISWPHALREFVGRFQGIQQQHGTGAVAILSTGQIVTEEMALLGALAKFGMGIRHLDSNTRQCMATAHVAYKQSFGFDAPPFTYADFEASDALVFIGANPCIAHPIMWQRVMLNRRRPELVVIDPRATETAQAATLHVAPEPKTDLALLYGLAHRLIARGAIDLGFIAAHTNG